MADQPDHLDVLADELLALSMPGLAYGSDRARWERNARGVIARIFRLGTAAGWDKAVAAQDGPEPARPGTAGPALVKESEIALLAEQLTEVASAVVRLQSRLARGGYPRRVALAELAQAGECLETAATGLRES